MFYGLFEGPTQDAQQLGRLSIKRLPHWFCGVDCPTSIYWIRCLVFVLKFWSCTCMQYFCVAIQVLQCTVCTCEDLKPSGTSWNHRPLFGKWTKTQRLWHIGFRRTHWCTTSSWLVSSWSADHHPVEVRVLPYTYHLPFTARYVLTSRHERRVEAIVDDARPRFASQHRSVSFQMRSLELRTKHCSVECRFMVKRGGCAGSGWWSRIVGGHGWMLVDLGSVRGILIEPYSSWLGADGRLQRQHLKGPFCPCHTCCFKELGLAGHGLKWSRQLIAAVCRVHEPMGVTGSPVPLQGDSHYNTFRTFRTLHILGSWPYHTYLDISYGDQVYQHFSSGASPSCGPTMPAAGSRKLPRRFCFPISPPCRCQPDTGQLVRHG